MVFVRGMQFFTESGSGGVAGKAFGGHRKADLVERNASVVLRSVLRRILDFEKTPDTNLEGDNAGKLHVEPSWEPSWEPRFRPRELASSSKFGGF